MDARFYKKTSTLEVFGTIKEYQSNAVPEVYARQHVVGWRSLKPVTGVQLIKEIETTRTNGFNPIIVKIFQQEFETPYGNNVIVQIKAEYVRRHGKDYIQQTGCEVEIIQDDGLSDKEHIAQLQGCVDIFGFGKGKLF